MWTCPICKSEFKTKNQSHSCGDFSIENVFIKIPLNIFQLFEVLHDKVQSFGPLQIRPVKNGVMYSSSSTFLALKPHSNYLAIEFACGNAYGEFPIEKCVKVSKVEFAHIMRIENKSEIDLQLINWLKESYQFNCSKNK